MDNSDMQRIRHIKSYCEDIADAYAAMNKSVIWETAVKDIPVLLSARKHLRRWRKTQNPTR